MTTTATQASLLVVGLLLSGIVTGAGLPPVTESQPIGVPPPPPEAGAQARQPGQATASSGSTEARLSRLERQLDSQMLIEMLSRLEAMQMELQELRGIVEMQDHKMSSLEQRQRDLYVDIDRRMRQIETSGVAAASTGQPQVALPQAPATVPATPRAPVTPAPAGAPRLPAAAAEAEDPAAERQAYQQAFEHLQEGRYEAAVTAFRRYLDQYPDRDLSSNAQYWLGEAQYVMRQFAEAITEFDKVLADYPNSGKAPDALLKLGFSHYELQDWEKAGEILNRVIEEFPRSTASQLAENRLHQMRLEGRL